MLSLDTVTSVALPAWRDRDDLTLDELVEAADALLREVKQTRYAVSERPDVRTVRYYTTRGLLPKPLSYDGGRARYGYAHLVRLLAIKRMQAEHFTLEQVARALERKNDDDVTALVETRTHADVVTPPRSLDQVPPLRPAADDDRVPVRPAGGALALELAPGGRVIVEPAVMQDPEKRERLADNLEQLARMLRATGG